MIKYSPIVALDVANLDQVNTILKQLDVNPRPMVKIGMEVFYHFGPRIVKHVQAMGFTVFLDLKLHDIPNTVERAARVIGALGVEMTTIHAAGGSEMLAASKRGLMQGAQEIGKAPAKLLAITQLTSIDDQILHNQQYVAISLQKSVQNYAKLAESTGLDGVICSALEVPVIREVVNPDFLCITPGIRPNSAQNGDQKRVVTPNQATKLGSNGIVVGRPITQSVDPKLAYKQIAEEFKEEK